MARRVATKAVVEKTVVGVLADGGRNELAGITFGKIGAFGDRDVEANEILGPVSEIGLASGEEVGSWLAKQILHSLGDDPSAHQRQGQAKPSHVQLPKLALPDKGFGSARGHSRTGHEYEGYDEDDGDRKDGIAHQKPHRVDRLMFGEGEATDDDVD